MQQLLNQNTTQEMPEQMQSGGINDRGSGGISFFFFLLFFFKVKIMPEHAFGEGEPAAGVPLRAGVQALVRHGRVRLGFEFLVLSSAQR